MALTEHKDSMRVNYSADTVFENMKKMNNSMVYSNIGFKLSNIKENSKTLIFKAGVSLKSWGETITVSINENADKSSTINIISSPKTGIMFGGGFDLGKNRENINKLMELIASWLKDHEIEIQTVSTRDDNLSKIKQLKELLDIGAITQEEFNKKKKELLEL